MSSSALDAPTVFEAVIVPHRSLGPSAARWLAAVLIGLSMAISTFLWWLGAWPVIGFNGAEIALALVLLRHNGQTSRRRETLLLSPAALRVVTTGPRGAIDERVFDPFWVRALFEERRGRPPALWLTHRERRLEIASSLGRLEKRDLADALQTALDQLRAPVFDNPQLRSL